MTLNVDVPHFPADVAKALEAVEARKAEFKVKKEAAEVKLVSGSA